MDFKQKCKLIDEARSAHPDFDEYFKDMMGSGLSNTGVYRTIPLEKIPGYKKPEPEKPASTEKTEDKKTSK